jgi:hypothetical protein
MSQLGQKRRFDPLPATSGLPQPTDIVRPARLVRFVPIAEVVLVRRVTIRCRGNISLVRRMRNGSIEPYPTWAKDEG